VGAGAKCAGFVMLRLLYTVVPLFEAWLGRHFSDPRQKVLSHIREVRGGKLNDPNFGSRMRGSGPFAELIADVFVKARDCAAIPRRAPELTTDNFRRPAAQ
jgi:DNA repair photolyase